MEAFLEPVSRLDRDLIRAIKDGEFTMSRRDIRYVVDLYYQVQEYRKAAGNQEGASAKEAEPTGLLGYVIDQMHTLESQIKRAMDAWTSSDPVSLWAKSNVGVGPVISAGLAAHIDITRAPTVGHIWRFAGLDPSVKWLGREGAKKVVAKHVPKGDVPGVEHVRAIAAALGLSPATPLRFFAENGDDKKTPAARLKAIESAFARCPYNKRLKVLCWKIGDSFVKFHNHKDCRYGHLYAERKAIEVEKNERGDFGFLAEKTLDEKKIQDKKARGFYEGGKLPPGRIDLRARRWAVKLFLAHWHETAYRAHFGEEPPLPYPIAVLGHAHHITA